MKRAVVIVIDSMGIGAMPDCRDFNDVPECNTLKHVCEFNNGLNVPNLEKMGLGNIQKFKGISPVKTPIAQYGTMKENARGKDTTTGHWEIAGYTIPAPFATFPNGFPKELVDEFIAKTNCGGILANRPASGTAIIEELNDEHHKTGFPIVYTSADSVFQIAVDTDLIPLETLYEWCDTARKILDEGNWNVSRVIARPYKIIDGKPTRISKDRRDYSMIPKNTILDEIKEKGGQVIGIGKIEDIFAKAGITHAIHTGSNKEGLELTLKAVRKELPLEPLAYSDYKIKSSSPSPACPAPAGQPATALSNTPLERYAHVPYREPFSDSENPFTSLIFTNLVDTDMLYGHRNDAKGYGKAIEEIDTYLTPIMEAMSDEDLLIITADHGCDPCVEGTDHTREYVPVLIYRKGIEPKDLGTLVGFDNVAKIIKEWLF